MNIGTTFDYEHAKSLNLDYKQVLDKILELNLSPIRIGIKWSRVEVEKGKYDWEAYDHILDKLNRHKVPTILTTGLKSPRWPEFYIPNWTGYDFQHRRYSIANNDDVQEPLFDFIDKTLQRYKKLSNIKWIQVENESFFPFGPQYWSITKDFLQEEINFVKKITKLPIILTDSGLPTTGVLSELLNFRIIKKKKLIELANVVGFNIFPKIEGNILKKWKHVFSASKLSWWYLNKWIRNAQKMDRKVWITELQAEPWEQKLNYTDAYAHKTCNPDLVKEYIQKLSTKVDTILLWGVEFWIKCLEEGNNNWVELVRQLGNLIISQ